MAIRDTDAATNSGRTSADYGSLCKLVARSGTPETQAWFAAAAQHPDIVGAKEITPALLFRVLQATMPNVSAGVTRNY